jgi:S-layer family protein
MQPGPRMPARRLTLIGFIAAIVLAVPMTVLASHQFSDVPNSSFYHNDIDALVDAGITTGCGGGKYCPANAVTREQMATFLHRGLGRAAMSNTVIDDTIFVADQWVTVAAVTIEVGSVGGNQFVEVNGATTVSGVLADCAQCPVNARLRDAGTGSLTSESYYLLEPGVFDQDVVARHQVYSATPGAHTYQLQVRVFQTSSSLFIANPTITATTYAFGSTGGSTLSVTEAAEGNSEPSTDGTVPAR